MRKLHSDRDICNTNMPPSDDQTKGAPCFYADSLGKLHRNQELRIKYPSKKWSNLSKYFKTFLQETFFYVFWALCQTSSSGVTMIFLGVPVGIYQRLCSKSFSRFFFKFLVILAISIIWAARRWVDKESVPNSSDPHKFLLHASIGQSITKTAS